MVNIKTEEAVLSKLVSLYKRHGYKIYKPICFEDYSLYLDNIDFLISKNVLTFSGTEGKLLALRPDVTLSIISHAQNVEGTQKLFYNEKVYRRSADGGEFKDINQAGVEVIGDIDVACEAEIAILIVDTLAAISDNYILDISHMAYTEGLMSALNLRNEDKEQVYSYIRSKNIHDFLAFAQDKRLNEEAVNAFQKMINISGDAKSSLKVIRDCVLNDSMRSAADELEKLTDILTGLKYIEKININFSIANSADYYNGIIFNGYIGGVSRSVLSGGRYDKLLKKMGKEGGAIGFALYLGVLERYFQSDNNFVNVLIIYDCSTQYEALKLSNRLLKDGKSVRISKNMPDDLKFGEIVDLTGGHSD